MKKLILLFNHPDNIQDKISIIYTKVLLILSLFYLVYFIVNLNIYPPLHRQNITNYFGLLAFLIAFITNRNNKNPKNSMMVLAVFPLPLIFINIYNTGGLYSFNMVIIFSYLIMSILIISRKFSFIINACNIIFISFLYYKHNVNPLFFNNYLNNETLIDSFYFNWVGIILIVFTTLFFFTKNVDRIHHENNKLQKKQIEDLHIEVQNATNNLSELRNQLAIDFHDEIGNTLASINLLSKALKTYTLQDDSYLSTLELIEQQSNTLSLKTKDFIWSIDFKSDRVIELFYYLRSFGENLFTNLPISFLPVYDKKIETQFVNVHYSLHIIMIVKELMTNIIKHANAQRVDFKMYVQDVTLTIFIKDDGIGFNPKLNNKMNTNGLKNINQRIKKIKGSLNYHSNSNGSEFTLNICTKKNI